MGSRTRRAAGGLQRRERSGMNQGPSRPGATSQAPEESMAFLRKMGSHRRGQSRGPTWCDLCARVTQAAALRKDSGRGWVVVREEARAVRRAL